MNRTQALIELQNVSKRYRRRTAGSTRDTYAMRSVNLAIRPGEVVALVGESGSGKSTTGAIIAGLEKPTSGTVVFAGDTLPSRLSGDQLKDYRRRVQIIFQDPFSSLNPVHTIGYHLMRPLLIHKVAASRAMALQAAEGLLEAVGLQPAANYLHKMPHQLSGGQRQRVGIARVLATNPELLVADEPTSMLDVSLRLDIMNLLLDLRDKRQLGMLYITHDLSGAHYMADRIMVMYRGMIVEEGLSGVLLSSPSHPYTQILMNALTRDITGMEDIPSPVDTQSAEQGCSFANRCPHRMAVCVSELPDWATVEEGHRVNCHLYSCSS